MVRKLDPEKRAGFLDAALRLFVVNGIQSTSTASIAKEAGAAAGTLFIYFSTKQDLIHELVLKISREQSDYIQSVLEPGLSARDTFWAIWEGSIGWFLANMEAYRYIQQVRDSGIIAEAVIQQTEKDLIYYFTAVQKGLEEGSIKPYPVEITGNFLYHTIVFVMDLIRDQPDPAKQEEYIQIGFDIFWDGIKSGN